MSFIGLDFGSSAIKAVELVKSGSGWLLAKYGMAASPEVNIATSVESDQEMVAAAVRKLWHELKTDQKQVYVSLPQSQVYMHVISTPSLTERELEGAIKWQAEQYIPQPLNTVVLSFSVLDKPEKSGGQMKVLLAAAGIAVVEKYKRVMDLAGLEPLSLETDITALARVFAKTQSSALVNIGAGGTEMAILNKKAVLDFVFNFSTGGSAITAAVAQAFSFDRLQALEYVKAYGLDNRHFEGKVAEAISPVVNRIIAETAKSIAFYEQQDPQEKVASLILTGGTAYLPGIVPRFTQNTGIETALGDPWREILPVAGLETDRQQALIFAVATGLAMR